jgi:isopentenyldiphosphate isomerase
MDSPRGHKYSTFLSELGVAFIDTDTIRDHPNCWQEYITTSHAIVAEHWDHHPHRRCQDKMGIDDRLPFYPRFDTSAKPSGSLQEVRTFAVDGEFCTASMSPDSEIISRDQCGEWLLNKVCQEAASERLPTSTG